MAEFLSWIRLEYPVIPVVFYGLATERTRPGAEGNIKLTISGVPCRPPT